jgi:hypothetical protein
MRPGRARQIAAGPRRLACIGDVGRSDPDAGMVTAEFAVALPAFVVVVLAALCGVAVVTAQLRCADAAAVAARMVARGERPALVQTVIAATAPRGAELSVAQSGGLVTASVSARLRLPLLGSLLPAVNVGADVVEPREPATGSQP